MTIKIRTSTPNSLAKTEWQVVMLDTFNLTFKSLTTLPAQKAIDSTCEGKSQLLTPAFKAFNDLATWYLHNPKSPTPKT